MGKAAFPPGFRFSPTDVELVKYYLKRKVMGKRVRVQVIADVDIYKYAPWDLPGTFYLLLLFVFCSCIGLALYCFSLCCIYFQTNLVGDMEI